MPDAATTQPGPANQLIKVPPAKVGLSTSSVYPETTSSAFELARRLGYDGVELMVGIDPVAADIDAVEKLRDYHGVPVLVGALAVPADHPAGLGDRPVGRSWSARPRRRVGSSAEWSSCTRPSAGSATTPAGSSRASSG